MLIGLVRGYTEGVGLGLYFAPADAKALAGRRKVVENHACPPLEERQALGRKRG